MPACADFVLVSAPGKLRPGDDRPEHAAVRAGAPAGRKPRNTSQSEAIRRTSSRALKGFAFLGMRSSISPGYSPRPRWWPSPIVGRYAAHAPGGHFSTAHSVHAPCRAPSRACACFLRSVSTLCVARAFRSCANFSWRAADSSGRELHQPLAVHSPSLFSPVSSYFCGPPPSQMPAEPGYCDAASYRSTPRHRGRPACCCAHGEPFQK